MIKVMERPQLPIIKKNTMTLLNSLIKSKKLSLKNGKNTPYFEGCMPIEVMAERGIDIKTWTNETFGLTNANDPSTKPYTVIQLRQDNSIGSLWNIVGFQTKMTHEEQKMFLRKYGLENAAFARLGFT